MRLPSQYRHRYAGEVLYADHWVGELLRAVRGVDGGDDAIVLLTADHGESFGEDGFYFAPRPHHDAGPEPRPVHPLRTGASSRSAVRSW